MIVWHLLYGGIAVLVLYGVFNHYVIQPRRDRVEYGDAWQEFNDAAFHPQPIGKGASGVRARVIRVAEEMESRGGKRGVRVRSNGGAAVHESRADYSFSSRGPYYIKSREPSWWTTGRRHLVELEQGRFKASNPNGGEVYETGVRIVEWDTAHYPPISLRDYAAFQRKIRTLADIAALEVPTCAQSGLSDEEYQRWVAKLAKPFGRYEWVPIVAVMLGFGLLVVRDAGSNFSTSLVLVPIFSVVVGLLPGGVVGGILIPAIARRAIAISNQQAGRVWAIVQAQKQQGAAEKELSRYTPARTAPTQLDALDVAHGRLTRYASRISTR